MFSYFYSQVESSTIYEGVSDVFKIFYDGTSRMVLLCKGRDFGHLLLLQNFDAQMFGHLKQVT